MLSTNDPFDEKELLLRSIWPANQRPSFWNGNRLASSAFKDPKGLSVSRVYTRPLDEAVNWMKDHFHGPVFSISVYVCNSINIIIRNKPSKLVPYHYELHGGEELVELTDEQALLLSRNVRRETHE